MLDYNRVHNFLVQIVKMIAFFEIEILNWLNSFTDMLLAPVSYFRCVVIFRLYCIIKWYQCWILGYLYVSITELLLSDYYSVLWLLLNLCHLAFTFPNSGQEVRPWSLLLEVLLVAETGFANKNWWKLVSDKSHVFKKQVPVSMFSSRHLVFHISSFIPLMDICYRFSCPVYCQWT